jgi:hypothetical protein
MSFRSLTLIGAAMLRIACFLCLAISPAWAQSWRDRFDGTWIWDASRFVPWPGMANDVVMVSETMSVSRDDGDHFTARIDEAWSNGGQRVLIEDFPEDGKDHPVQMEDRQMMIRITAPPDGTRHVVSHIGGDLHDATCSITDSGMTLYCAGQHREPDGSGGYFRCVYHRDPHIVPVASLKMRMGLAYG